MHKAVHTNTNTGHSYNCQPMTDKVWKKFKPILVIQVLTGAAKHGMGDRMF